MSIRKQLPRGNPTRYEIFTKNNATTQGSGNQTPQCGIESICFYIPRYYLPLETLAERRKEDPQNILRDWVRKKWPFHLLMKTS